MSEANTDIINLAIRHDGTEVANSYINMIVERFSDYFSKIFIVSEDEIEGLKESEKISVVSFIKPVNNNCQWLMLLEIGEIPSLQLMQNLKDIVVKAPNETNILFFPIALCDYNNSEIIDILEPVGRIYRQKPTIKNTDMEEIILEDFPIIVFRIEESLEIQE
ncbi:MAG: hypothetical protein U0354_17185 [Candidatus Sericytochromatia bacterium]